MDRTKRLRRVALLCCHFTRNCAYYRAGWSKGKSKATNDFAITIQNNFIDIAILEWLKLFGGHNDKHHWKKIVSNKEEFKSQFLTACEITDNKFEEYQDELKKYRDKFVAHLDGEEKMNIPQLDISITAVKHYYKYILNELGDLNLGNLPKNLDDYYKICFDESIKFFGE